MTKRETRQWNLNQTVGWKCPNEEDFTVLFIKSNNIDDKSRFDKAVLQELKSNKIGDQAENDEQTETDFHFIVSKNYQKAIAVILSIAKIYNLEQQITVYERDFQSYDKWTDKVVYPE